VQPNKLGVKEVVHQGEAKNWMITQWRNAGQFKTIEFDQAGVLD